MDLTNEPLNHASHFLQLATPKVARWKIGDKAGHRIDRVPFSAVQRKGVQRILAEVRAGDPSDGWVKVATRDDGRMMLFIKYVADSANFDTLNVLVDGLTSEISSVLHRLMQECALMLWPMAFAASAEAAQAVDCDWPKVEVFTSATRLQGVLARGPYHWWRHMPQ